MRCNNGAITSTPDCISTEACTRILRIYQMFIAPSLSLFVWIRSKSNILNFSFLLNTLGIKKIFQLVNINVYIDCHFWTRYTGTYIVRHLLSYGWFKSRMGDLVTNPPPPLTFDSTICQGFVRSGLGNLGQRRW